MDYSLLLGVHRVKSGSATVSRQTSAVVRSHCSLTVVITIHWCDVVQFSSINLSSVVLRGKVSERLQPEKMSLEPCW